MVINRRIDQVDFSNNESRKRYEDLAEGKLAVFPECIAMNGLIIMSHTEILPAFEDQGVGSALAKYALNDIRAEGSRKVQPLCPFTKAWIDRHPDYQDLVG